MRNIALRVIIATLAVAGIVVSSLALRVHYQDPNAAPPCAVTEKFDCGAVNHSRFAVFPPRTFDEALNSTKTHIPVAIIGIGGYAAMFGFALAGRLWVTLQLAEIGFAAASFLTYLEAYVLEKWCIYCLWSHLIVAGILATTIVALILQRRNFRFFQMPNRVPENDSADIRAMEHQLR